MAATIRPTEEVKVTPRRQTHLQELFDDLGDAYDLHLGTRAIQEREARMRRYMERIGVRGIEVVQS